MADEEIRDELLTALVAGHETTASSLAFAFEQLARAPARAGAPAPTATTRYLEATINEIAAPPAGAAQPRAAAGQAGDHDRRLDVPARAWC